MPSIVKSQPDLQSPVADRQTVDDLSVLVMHNEKTGTRDPLASVLSKINSCNPRGILNQNTISKPSILPLLTPSPSLDAFRPAGALIDWHLQICLAIRT